MSIINLKTVDSGVEHLTINGPKLSDNGMIAEKFSNYFTGIVQNLAANIPTCTSMGSYTDYLSPPPPNSFAITPTSPEELFMLNDTLKIPHSSEPDDLDPTIVSSNLSLIAAPLADFINCSLKTGIIPAKMKISTVTPIHKQASRNNMSANCRPISILPFFQNYWRKYRINALMTIISKNIIPCTTWF